MSTHRIVVELRNLHPQIWRTLTAEQRRKALEATHGEADRKTLEKAYRVARKGN